MTVPLPPVGRELPVEEAVSVSRSVASRLAAGLRRVVHDLEPERMDARDAVELLETFVEIERLSVAAKALLIKRIDDARIWVKDGHRSAAHLLAATSGTSVGQAVGVVETARRLPELPRTEEELRAGRLSESQVREVAAAAAEAPHAERDLLDRARTDEFAGLKQYAARVKANAASGDDELARYRRIHATRYVRCWTDAEGADRGEWQLTPDAGARVRAALRAEQDGVFAEARAEGRREPVEAYAADALVALAERALEGDTTGAARSATTTALLRLDVTALRHGTTAGDEVCEIAGVGPIPIAVARELLGDALLKIVITQGRRRAQRHARGPDPDRAGADRAAVALHRVRRGRLPSAGPPRVPPHRALPADQGQQAARAGTPVLTPARPRHPPRLSPATTTRRRIRPPPARQRGRGRARPAP